MSGASIHPDSPGLRVLVLAPTGRDAHLLCELIEAEARPCTVVGTLAELTDLVRRSTEAGLLMIAEEAVSGDGASRLAEVLAEQPAWSDVPVLVLGAQTSRHETVRPLLGLRGVDLLDRPLRTSSLKAAVQVALENRRRQYEIRDLLAESRKLSWRLERRAAQLRRLTLELTDTEERERRRLAEYVHDDLQQILAGVLFHIDLTERKLRDPDAARAGLERVRDLLASAIAGTRSLSQELSPTALRSSGLVAALRWLAGHVRDLHGLEVSLEAPAGVEPTDDSTVTFLFRAAQELLLNVVKHAQTDRAEVILSVDGTLFQLMVRDHGVGFAVPDSDDEEVEVEDHDTSFGLFSIRERAEIFGGEVQLESTPKSGTTVRILLPSDLPAAGAVSGPGAPGTSSAEAGAAPTAAAPVRVVLVDDHTVLRSGLKLLLVEHPEIDVVGEIDDGEQAIRAAAQLAPDIMVMDVAMPNLDGVEATRAIKRRHPGIRIIGLSMFQDQETADRMLSAGADAYLPKTGPSERLVDEILRR
ncbi:MAG: response regulator [Spirochaetota bacterium]